VKIALLHNLVTLDSAPFEAFVRHLGFSSAACYRLGEKGLMQIVSTGASTQWPAAVSRVADPHHYTTIEGLAGKLGWDRADNLLGGGKLWPKQAYLYFPEQGIADTKLVLAVTNPSGKRCRTGELSAPLEALATRLRSIIQRGQVAHELTDQSVAEHMRAVGVDVINLLDHETRTPLAAINGFLALIKDLDPTREAEQFREYWSVIDLQLKQAVQAVDKLSLAFGDRMRGLDQGLVEAFDADDELRGACDSIRGEAPGLIAPELVGKLNIRYLRSTDRACVLRADRRLFGWAVREVLRNAVLHARSGRVDVAVFTADRMLVIDIEDDGPGVAAGMEELIFLRFFQDPSSSAARRARRGMGLGLYLARQIVERHLGHLNLVKSKGRGTVFRFLWPLAEESSAPGPNVAPALVASALQSASDESEDTIAALGAWREGA